MDIPTTPHTATLGDFMVEYGRVSAVLEGYPIDQLLGFFVGNAAEQAAGQRVVDQCLTSWIAALDTALATMPSGPCESLVSVDGRQRGARDALMRLKSALPPAHLAAGRRSPLS